MRIAIDARELIDKPTGVGRYLTELLAAWARLPAAAAHEFVLCSNQPIEPAATPPHTEVVMARGHGTLWQQLVLPRLLRSTRAGVLLAPAYAGPVVAPVPVVIAIHDVSFFAHPEWFGTREGLRLRHLTRLSARRAARIVACSDFSRQEIVRFLPSTRDKIDVVYLGATRVGSEGRAEAARHQPDWTRGPEPDSGERLVLYAGSIFARRHIPELVDAFGRLAARHPEARLDLVGENRSNPRIDLEALVAASDAADRIRARAYVTESQLASLYRHASAFVFLSDYEGFGLTPLEALSAGVPIVVLDTPVSREIYGAAACYVERPDPGVIAASLERVLFDTEERARLLNAASAVLARYSWDECARRTLQILLANGR